MKAIFNSPCILFAIPKSVSLIIGGRSTSGFSANKRFSGFKSYKIRGETIRLRARGLEASSKPSISKKNRDGELRFCSGGVKKKKTESLGWGRVVY